jgi:hypothetical protein
MSKVCQFPWGPIATTVTLLTILFAIVMPFFLPRIAGISFFSVSFLILLWAGLKSPYALNASTEELTILRPLQPIRIPVASVRRISPVAPNDMKSLVRTFGSGGLFGFYGHFYNARLGHIRLYTRKLTTRRLILIETYDMGKLVVYCSEPDLLERISRISLS